jgi:hypothetical protein
VELVRPEGWHARLKAVLREAVIRPFNRKTWNCAVFAHSCAQEVSGRVLPFRRYGTLEKSVDAVLPRISRRQAIRGDVVLADIQKPCLGVCLGAKAAFVKPTGLTEVPMSQVRIAWRV